MSLFISIGANGVTDVAATLFFDAMLPIRCDADMAPQSQGGNISSWGASVVSTRCDRIFDLGPKVSSSLGHCSINVATVVHHLVVAKA